MSLERIAWNVWLKRMANANGPHKTDAQLLLGVGGLEPAETKARIFRLRKANLIDHEGYETRMASFIVMSPQYKDGVKLVDTRDPKDWLMLGSGASMRKTHGIHDSDEHYTS